MECVFFGCVDNVKGYGMWDPTIHKVVVVSSDVIFAGSDVIFVDELQNEKTNDNFTKVLP